MIDAPNPPGFWRALGLLLRTARRRSIGRQKRAQKLLAQRRGKPVPDWNIFSYLLSIAFMLVIHCLAAAGFITAIGAAQRADADHNGTIVVHQSFITTLNDASSLQPQDRPENIITPAIQQEARSIATRTGGDRNVIAARLADTFNTYGTTHFINADDLPGLHNPQRLGAYPLLILTLLIAMWLSILVFQSEGLELDLQRNRNPVWEWLLSHPIPPSAVFFSEMLSPLAGNPVFWSAPFLPAILFGYAFQDPIIGLIALFAIGLPIILAASCLGKALEIAIMLRAAPRTRGALMGILSWIGYATLMFFLIAYAFLSKAITAIAPYFYRIPFPRLTPVTWIFGASPIAPAAPPSFTLAIITCAVISTLVILFSLVFSAWGANRGLIANPGAHADRPRTSSLVQRFRDPLYRKELLWFLRDRSAIVQSILIPLTVAGFQLFNLRGLIVVAGHAWNYLGGLAIFFGTYFLWVLGPRSLSSEGSALWIALTWPRGLESLLKAKARLWSLLSAALVLPIFIFTAIRFPSNIPGIALLAGGWLFFSRSMAEKSVTLVTVTSDSGEVQRIPKGRRYAAQLGMLTFAIGVLTQQWPLACTGLVYSYITSAAMWQNFRARLPFLFDPWSEELPPAPTLMHAMVGISIMIEAGAIIFGIAAAIAHFTSGSITDSSVAGTLATTRAFAYGASAIAVCIGMHSFLGNRNVTLHDIITWRGETPSAIDHSAILPQNPFRFLGRTGSQNSSLWTSLPIAALLAFILAFFAYAYTLLLAHIPSLTTTLQQSHQAFQNLGVKIPFLIMSVLFAPFAEEYLFRGLLYRALDREWGGWAAVAGSACFFAIYHPVTSWPPVFLLGATSALLFKKTGRLAPCILLHAIYNLVVVLLT